MMQRLLLFSPILIVLSVLIASTKCGRIPMRHVRHSLSYQPSQQSLANPYLEDRPPPRHQIQRYPDTDGRGSIRGATSSRAGPERGQILHRPKSTEKKRYPKSNSYSSSPQQSMSDGGPVILNRGNGVKYVPLQGSSASSGSASGYQSNSQEQQNRPSVYVISGGGDDDEDNDGIMGSMQTYFKSFRGRIKSAMYGLIGQDGDDRQLS